MSSSASLAAAERASGPSSRPGERTSGKATAQSQARDPARPAAITAIKPAGQPTHALFGTPQPFELVRRGLLTSPILPGQRHLSYLNIKPGPPSGERPRLASDLKQRLMYRPGYALRAVDGAGSGHLPVRQRSPRRFAQDGVDEPGQQVVGIVVQRAGFGDLGIGADPRAQTAVSRPHPLHRRYPHSPL